MLYLSAREWVCLWGISGEWGWFLTVRVRWGCVEGSFRRGEWLWDVWGFDWFRRRCIGFVMSKPHHVRVAYEEEASWSG